MRIVNGRAKNKSVYFAKHRQIIIIPSWLLLLLLLLLSLALLL
jgi:hypothetical protein